MTLLNKQDDTAQPYMPEKLPPTNAEVKAPEYPNIAHSTQAPIFTREFGEAINRGITDMKKDRNSDRGMSESRLVPQHSMSKKERRKAKWNNFWGGFKKGFGKVWNFAKNIVPFVPYGNAISQGMNIAEKGAGAISNLIHHRK